LVLPLAADRRAPAIAGVDMYPHRDHVLVLVLLPPSAGPFRPPFAAGDVARAAGVGYWARVNFDPGQTHRAHCQPQWLTGRVCKEIFRAFLLIGKTPENAN
jgi:hypothetical protein